MPILRLKSRNLWTNLKRKKPMRVNPTRKMMTLPPVMKIQRNLRKRNRKRKRRKRTTVRAKKTMVKETTMTTMTAVKMKQPQIVMIPT